MATATSTRPRPGTALDGDPSTSWRTDTYRGTAEFSGIKPGVGLILSTPAAVAATRLSMTGGLGGWTGRVYTASGTAPPTSIGGWTPASKPFSARTVPMDIPPNLLGTGEVTIRPRIVGSLERDRVAVHGDFGYLFGGVSGELSYGTAVTMVATPRLTVIGELAARRLGSIGRLAETSQAHPTLEGVETVRLTALPETTHRAIFVVGVKWNVAGEGILGGHVMRPVTSAGLNSRWVAALTFDYSFGY